jgi:hypothetical protein
MTTIKKWSIYYYFIPYAHKVGTDYGVSQKLHYTVLLYTTGSNTDGLLGVTLNVEECCYTSIRGYLQCFDIVLYVCSLSSFR